MDLSGSTAGPRGSLQQLLQTEPGTTYQVRFQLAGNPEGGPAVKRLAVIWAPVGAGAGAPTIRPFAFDTTARSFTGMGWVVRQFAVQATTAQAILRFDSFIGTVYGPVIDDVPVIAQ